MRRTDAKVAKGITESREKNWLKLELYDKKKKGSKIRGKERGEGERGTSRGEKDTLEGGRPPGKGQDEKTLGDRGVTE